MQLRNMMPSDTRFIANLVYRDTCDGVLYFMFPMAYDKHTAIAIAIDRESDVHNFTLIWNNSNVPKDYGNGASCALDHHRMHSLSLAPFQSAHSRSIVFLT